MPAIHVQDLWSLEERGSFAAVGTGIVKVKEAVHAAGDTGVGRVVVEQDRLRNLTAFDTITVSSLYLEEAELMWRLVWRVAQGAGPRASGVARGPCRTA